MANFSGAHRWGPSTSLSVGSTTAVASTAVFGTQCRTIRVISAVGSCNALVIDATVSSVLVDTTGMLILPGLPPEPIQVGPGQRLALHGRSVTTAVVWVTEALQ